MDNLWVPPELPDDWEKDPFYTEFLGWDPQNTQFMDRMRDLFTRDPTRCILDKEHTTRFKSRDELVRHYASDHQDDFRSTDRLDDILDDPVTAALYMEMRLRWDQEAIRKLFEEKEELRQSMTEIKNRLGASDAAMNDSGETVRDLIMDLQQQVKGLEGVQNELDEVNQARDRLETELGNARELVAHYEKAIGEIGSDPGTAEVARLQEELAGLREELAKYQGDSDSDSRPWIPPESVDGFKREISELENRVKELEEAKEALIKAGEELAAEVGDDGEKELREKLKAAIQAANAMQARLTEVTAERDGLVSERDEIVENLEREADLKRELANCQQKLIELGKELEKGEDAKYALWNAKVRNLEAEVQRLRDQLSAKKEADIDLQRLESTNKILGKKIASMIGGSGESIKKVIRKMVETEEKRARELADAERS